MDYELAHKEILQKQEEELRRELEEEKQAALGQIELERLENERNYHEQVELLELEKFKYNCSKELLETEKKALADKTGNEEPFQYTPYKSTLVDDIKRIMQHPTEESLHKTQLKVKTYYNCMGEVQPSIRFIRIMRIGCTRRSCWLIQLHSMHPS